MKFVVVGNWHLGSIWYKIYDLKQILCQSKHYFDFSFHLSNLACMISKGIHLISLYIMDLVWWTGTYLEADLEMYLIWWRDLLNEKVTKLTLTRWPSGEYSSSEKVKSMSSMSFSKMYLTFVLYSSVSSISKYYKTNQKKGCKILQV